MKNKLSFTVVIELFYLFDILLLYLYLVGQHSQFSVVVT